MGPFHRVVPQWTCGNEGERTLITIDMQADNNSTCRLSSTRVAMVVTWRVVGSPTDSRQEGGIGAWFHDLAGIPVVHLT